MDVLILIFRKEFTLSWVYEATEYTAFSTLCRVNWHLDSTFIIAQNAILYKYTEKKGRSMSRAASKIVGNSPLTIHLMV